MLLRRAVVRAAQALRSRQAVRTLSYAAPPGGLPPQTDLLTGRAKFTDAYAVIPKGVLRDIVTSPLPGWDKARSWVLARPLSGFAETFSQYVVELEPGGSGDGEPDEGVQGVLFVLKGSIQLTHEGTHEMSEGCFAYIPPGAQWTCASAEGASFVWIRKRYEPAPGYDKPDFLVTSDQLTERQPMPDTDGAWCTTRFVDPLDLRHDMHVTLVTFKPGACIPFEETHVMEHGLYILEGKAVYNLNQDWVEVEAGDFLWLRAFCPQACQATGGDPFRYLLYKDVNRHMPLSPAGL